MRGCVITGDCGSERRRESLRYDLKRLVLVVSFVHTFFIFFLNLKRS